jgi:hypothetical protein
MPDSPASWLDRMAHELAESQPSEALARAALEAAGEMKCVALKVALGRCHAILYEANQNDRTPTWPNGFLEEIEGLVK